MRKSHTKCVVKILDRLQVVKVVKVVKSSVVRS
jgi:hypothetical protein